MTFWRERERKLHESTIWSVARWTESPHATAAIQHGIEVPLRQLNGIFNGIRAGFGTFREKQRHSPAVEPAEEDLVVVVEEIIAARDGR